MEITLTPKKSKNKYGARKVHYKGLVFDSNWEFEHYLILLDDQRRGKIKDIKLHHRVDLVVNGQKICFMKIDFVITDNNGKVKYLDTKGMVTSNFRLKAKLFKALIGQEIKVIKRGGIK